MSFVEITGDDYTELLVRRLKGELPELTWLIQFRDLLTPYIRTGDTLVDIGCAVGYAYNAFKDLGVAYKGFDFEEAYLEIAREFFAGLPEVSFDTYDVISEKPPVTGDIVINSAMLEHCPGFLPGLEHLLDAAERILALRTFLGSIEEIYTLPSPVKEFEKAHSKYNNQYAWKDIMEYIASRGFKPRIYKDEYTQSIPQYVDGVMRTFYIVLAEKVDS